MFCNRQGCNSFFTLHFATKNIAMLSVAWMACAISGLAQKSLSSDPALWYTKPAAVWTEALPIGNGRIGAMVFGGANEGENNGDAEDAAKNRDLLDGSKTRAQEEHLQLNDSTLWQGRRADRLNPAAREGFDKARALLLSSKGTDSAKIAEAEKIAAQTLISTPRGMPGYSTLGDLYLRAEDAGAAKDYRRELNLFTGIVRVSYASGGVHYLREIFASQPDQVIVVHLTADKPGNLSFVLAMDRPEDFATSALGSHDLILTQGINHKEQINFQGQARVVADGGSVEARGNSLIVHQANEVTLLITSATDFKGGAFSGANPAEQCKRTLDAAGRKSFVQLRDAAAADERSLMSRVSFRLGSPDASLESLPTDERLRRVSAGSMDLGLQSLYFQYARYLLVGSSRPGGLPANLQGLWASGIGNPWGSKFTVNINTEMNYWIAEAANLGELHQPLFDFLDMARTPASGTATDVAQKYYGARGFVMHHNTDIWGDANPIDGVAYGIWPMGGAWITLHAWDHYAYSGDKEFLRQRAWPLLHDASLFFLDYLVDDGQGHLVTGPSLSPENKYMLPDGSKHSLTMGPTMDIEIVRELLERTVEAGGILGLDPAFCAQAKAAMEKLPPFKIGKLGNLQEWPLDYEESAPGHRHISHLWALFPGTQISRAHTPELAKAAEVTLKRRLDFGGGQTGWSRAWVVNYFAHLGDGEKAYESMQVLFRQSTFPNLMDTHPPGIFQIDGNLGGANGMLESLVQSRWYADHAEVDLLPALPAEWSEGEIRGIRLRGGAAIDMQWSKGKIASTLWQATQDEAFELRVPAGQKPASLQIDGRKLPPPQEKDGVIRFKLAKGSTCQLRFD
jgi:alpha-L-fucosidase 2